MSVTASYHPDSACQQSIIIGMWPLTNIGPAPAANQTGGWWKGSMPSSIGRTSHQVRLHVMLPLDSLSSTTHIVMHDYFKSLTTVRYLTFSMLWENLVTEVYKTIASNVGLFWWYRKIHYTWSMYLKRLDYCCIIFGCWYMQWNVTHFSSICQHIIGVHTGH